MELHPGDMYLNPAKSRILLQFVPEGLSSNQKKEQDKHFTDGLLCFCGYCKQSIEVYFELHNIESSFAPF
jgi:hypothetical protein